MEVRIGVRQVAREITFESEQSAEAIGEAVATALAEGNPLHLTDDRGRAFVIPADALGFVQIGGAEKGRVGFGAT